MPIYEYRCPNGHVFELFQRMTDDPPDGCQACGEGPVERVLYPVAVHFKGSGFYTTDYGRGSRKSGKDGDSGAASTDDSGAKKVETTTADKGSSSSAAAASSTD